MGNVIVFIVKFYLSIWFLLMFSVLLYICLYNWFIPNYSITESIFFNHDVSCTQLLSLYQSETNQLQNYGKKLNCQFVNYEVPNKNYRNFFKSGHIYHFELELNMPNSKVNQNLGMFMIRLCLFDSSGQRIYEINRPAILPYSSTILTLAKLVFYIPLYLIGYFSETYTIQVKLLDEHADVEELDFGQINRIRLEIETLKPIEIIPPSKLFISVNLKGIPYLMYFWPITSSILIIGCIFSISFLIYLCSILRRPMKSLNERTESDFTTTYFTDTFEDCSTFDQSLLLAGPT